VELQDHLEEEVEEVDEVNNVKPAQIADSKDDTKKDGDVQDEEVARQKSKTDRGLPKLPLTRTSRLGSNASPVADTKQSIQKEREMNENVLAEDELKEADKERKRVLSEKLSKKLEAAEESLRKLDDLELTLETEIKAMRRAMEK